MLRTAFNVPILHSRTESFENSFQLRLHQRLNIVADLLLADYLLLLRAAWVCSDRLACFVCSQLTYRHFTGLSITKCDIVCWLAEEYQAAVYKENEIGQFDVIDDNDIGKVEHFSFNMLTPYFSLN